ncbi:MAG: sulfatase-like hydrolase/transferase [Bryobacterales bacterium]|nr:sulfatase-like hydrolase/transferase [Bryobacterales bacterium]
MNRRTFLQGTLPAAALSQTPAARLPNVLLFCTDQQRFDTIHSLGNPHIRTPHLDRLVREGTAFTAAHCQTPICTPSRASFMTGCYASTLHVNRNGNEFFPPRHTPKLMSRILKNAGYDCGLVGKFHLSSGATRIEPRVDDGFRLFEWSHAPRADWPVEQQAYLRWLRAHGAEWKTAYRARQFPDRPAEYNAGIAAKLHEATWCAETAMGWLKNGLKAPWFIHVNTYAPHPPFDPPPEFLERMDPSSMPLPLWGPDEMKTQQPFSRVDFQSKPRDPSTYPSRYMKAAYYAQIEFVDHQLGRILEALEQTGQRDNTLIIFMSDHGETMGDHGYNHTGCRFHEGLVRVPLIFSWPGGIKKGIRSGALVELTDVLPTLLETLGLPVPSYVHGKSLHGILTGGTDPGRHREFVRAEYHDVLDLPDHTHANMLRNERYKLVCYHGHPSGELYDLEKDPDEFHNLWNDPNHKALRLELTSRLFDEWMLVTDPGQRRIAMS